MSLIAGFLTPIVALSALAVQLLGPMIFSVQSVELLVVSILTALALSMLGPGAYSLDGLRFGRRILKLPPENDRTSV